MPQAAEASQTDRAPFIYDFSCGHSAPDWVITTTIRRACPICRRGKAVMINKPCKVCGVIMVLPLRTNQRVHCSDECKKKAARAYSIVNPKTNWGHTPAEEIDVEKTLEGRPDPGVDPLDIVFAKYQEDPLYRFRPAPWR